MEKDRKREKRLVVMYGEKTEIHICIHGRACVCMCTRDQEKRSEIDRENALCTMRQETGASDKDEDATQNAGRKGCGELREVRARVVRL